jgi:hypothetical protein
VRARFIELHDLKRDYVSESRAILETRSKLTLIAPVVPAAIAINCPQVVSLHQLTPHPPSASRRPGLPAAAVPPVP